MKSATTITIEDKTKDRLEKLKLCKEESFNSMFNRILPEWASKIIELNNKEKDSCSNENPPLLKIHGETKNN